MYQQHMLLKLRKPILKYTLNKCHIHWLSSFKHLKLPISIEIPVAGSCMVLNIDVKLCSFVNARLMTLNGDVKLCFRSILDSHF